MTHNTLLIWQIFGFLFTSVFGAILHFLYEWSGNLIWISPISAINESTWEHMKLLFFPSFIFALFQSLFFKRGIYWSVKAKGIICGLIAIPVIFYTYIGVVGRSLGIINILIFFIACFIQYLSEYIGFKGNKKPRTGEMFSGIILFIIALLFVVFTFFPPRIGLFQDPLNGNYGF